MFLTTVTDLVAQPVWAQVLPFTDAPPKPEDVKAGWTAFALFLLLGVAVVLLAVSLVKQLKKTQVAKDAGVYGDAPAARRDSASSADSRDSGDSGDSGAPRGARASADPAGDPENHDHPTA
ncbi:hypothetical protein [Nocardioides panaciterrulae]|uniref:Uncharacterized protein n=1 Tax=Nocardioides panaciterrulae TaxID=661492 RepID=A0A7Y9JC33_9ACTN|nr:hypothetical protein [Nocardioides panaciterrulae]NYD42998.1 hypothetical protein [Nocardioides panaciterrulae]